MKKTLSLAMAVIFAFSLAGVALATGTAKKAKKMTHMKKAKTYRIYGAVSAVDATANTVTVKRKKGEVTLTVTPKTVIKVAGKKATLDKIVAGDRLYARYEKVKGVDTATYISAHTAMKKAKKAMKMKKAKKAAAK
ncbi:MAG: hypothetical protein M0Z58_05010 [Nitrospiraceae bacterium]|nr:hypothetical protein [Nitrospiraceae bacterium]